MINKKGNTNLVLIILFGILIILILLGRNIQKKDIDKSIKDGCRVEAYIQARKEITGGMDQELTDDQPDLILNLTNQLVEECFRAKGVKD